MNIGIFGGTFNPVHKGHIHLAEEIMKSEILDKLIIMPDRIPPHKQAEDLVSGEHRLNMCKLAFGNIRGAEFSDHELRQTGKSFSVLTLRYFHKIYPADRLYFIMGSDMLLSFKKWYLYKEILTLAGLICISRSVEDTIKLEPCAKELRSEGGEVVILQTEPVEISSSEVRELLKKNMDTSCYLTENVVQYIMNNNVYNEVL